jgi:hypothetical protein
LYSRAESRRLLSTFNILVRVLALDDLIIDPLLNSPFSDFEDAIQYYTAAENQIGVLLTRNLKNHKVAQITVMTAEGYLLSA